MTVPSGKPPQPWKFFLLWSVLLCGVCSAFASSELHWRHPLPGRGGFGPGAYGNGRFVIFTASGYAASFDGRVWEFSDELHGPYGIEVSSLAFGNGLFVTVGREIKVSVDGLNWTNVPRPLTNQLTVVMHDGARFVASGVSGAIIVSETGSEWSVVTNNMPQTFWPTGLAFGRNRYVTSGYWSANAQTSTNLVNWSPVPNIEWPSYGVVFGNSNFVLRSSLLYVSTNGGVNWTTTDMFPGYFLETVAFGDGTFVGALSTGSKLISTNGLNWTAPQGGTTQDDYGSLCYGSGEFLLTGSAIQTSSNGVAWEQQVFSRTKESLSVVSHIGNEFVCTGDGGTGYVPVFLSSNGSVWKKLATTNYLSFRSMAGMNGTYVAAGSIGYLYSSTNLSNWTVRLWTNTTNRYALVAAVGGKFVALGWTATAMSSDGVQWTEYPITNQPPLGAMVFDGTRFVTVDSTAADPVYGWTGHTGTSTDGTNWTIRLGAARGITFRDGLYVKVGEMGGISTSHNRTNWTQQTSGTTNRLMSVCQSPMGFAAVGSYGTFLISSNGTNWQQVPTKTLLNFLSVACDGSNFVASGGGGVIVHYGPQEVPATRVVSSTHSNGSAMVSFEGIDGFGFRLEQSQDLMEWKPSQWIPDGSPVLVSNVPPERMFFRTVFR